MVLFAFAGASCGRSGLDATQDSPRGFGGVGGAVSHTGGASGSGAGGTGGVHDGSASCGMQVWYATRAQSDVLLLLDRSSSMYWEISEDCVCSEADAVTSGYPESTACFDKPDCTNRWETVRLAVASTIRGATEINWGLKLFPTPNADQCFVSSEVEVPVGPDGADAVMDWLDAMTFSLSTPTGAALDVATTYLKTLPDTRPKMVLLATDGDPNCAEGSLYNIDWPGASDAARASYEAGFPVFVVGIGPNAGNLSELAQAGGTNDFYSVSSAQALLDAFAAIGNLLDLCTYVVDAEPPDRDNVVVYLDNRSIERDGADGWSYGGNERTYLFHGASCEQLEAGTASTVTVLFGCPPPPKAPLP